LNQKKIASERLTESRFRAGRLAIRRGGTLVLGLVLAGCIASEIQDPEGYDRSSAIRLFTDSYEHISEIYIEEVPTADLAQAGITSVASLDPEFQIEENESDISINYHGHSVGRLPRPEITDVDGWGALTASALEIERDVSPIIAESDSEALYQAAFDGIIGRLDRFSRYSGRDAARENRASRDGFGGIGVRIRVDDEGVRILSVMEKTPAEKAGLQVDDLITEIEGASAIGLSQREVVRRLRGPIRTKVHLVIQRSEPTEELPITVMRELVVPQTVQYHIDGNIAYMHVSNFNQGTARSVRQKIKEAQHSLGENLLGFVLDLRGNPGGLLDQGVEVADLFVSEGRIVSTHGRHPDSHQYFNAASDDLAEGLPVVVLLDGSSASASEIVAAALQDAGRAVLIGTNTFGKGTVQTVLRLPNEGELTLTWAHFRAPSGYVLNTFGVLPNLCTSGDVEGSADVLDRLRRGVFPLSRGPDIALTSGDSSQIAAFRARCPRRDGEPEIDLEVARAVLQNATLYARALHGAPESAAVQQEALIGDKEAACRSTPSDPSIQPGSC